jgi:hypothetical protein
LNGTKGGWVELQGAIEWKFWQEHQQESDIDPHNSTFQAFCASSVTLWNSPISKQSLLLHFLGYGERCDFLNCYNVEDNTVLFPNLVLIWPGNCCFLSLGCHMPYN